MMMMMMMMMMMIYIYIYIYNITRLVLFVPTLDGVGMSGLLGKVGEETRGEEGSGGVDGNCYMF